MNIVKRLSRVTGFVFTFGLFLPALALAAGPATVNLNSAGNYVILSKTAITTTGVTAITGDIGISPALSTDTSGFGLVLDGSGTFSTSALVSGRVYAADYSAPTPATLTTAISAMQAAYTDAATRTPGVGASNLDVGAGTLSGQNFVPGTFTWGSNVTITGDITFTGTASDIWIIQISGNLSIANGKKIILAGGALSSNIFWQVAGTTTVQPGATFSGIILAGPGASTIAFQSGAILNGRALGQTDVTLIGNTISSLAAAIVVPSSGGKKYGAVNVVKVVINDNGGTKKIVDFPLFVNGLRVISGDTNSFSAGDVLVTETSNTNYTATFSGDCNATGHINVSAGTNNFCIITNNDIGPATIVPAIPPLIDLIVVPSPLALPAGPGLVTYTYTVRNTGTVPVTDVTVVGDTCHQIVLSSGDTNFDKKLDMNEVWKYTCSITIPVTHTNNAVATGWANGISVADTGNSTVIVGAAIVAPLIHVTVIPNPLALLAGGGIVTYTEQVTNPGIVALSNVVLTNNACTPLQYVSGDVNNDSKLDVSEIWTYTCRVNITKTSINTAFASGNANNLTERDLALATVVVATAIPALPNTGFAPLMMSMQNIIILLSVVLLIVISAIIILKKRTV